jgi:hypothetical protein
MLAIQLHNIRHTALILLLLINIIHLIKNTLKCGISYTFLLPSPFLKRTVTCIGLICPVVSAFCHIFSVLPFFPRFIMAAPFIKPFLVGLTRNARFLSHASSCGIYVDPSGTETYFSLSNSLFPLSVTLHQFSMLIHSSTATPHNLTTGSVIKQNTYLLFYVAVCDFFLSYYHVFPWHTSCDSHSCLGPNALCVQWF